MIDNNKKPILQGVTVPWAPNYVKQSENGLETIHVEYMMPLVAALELMLLGIDGNQGAN